MSETRYVIYNNDKMFKGYFCGTYIQNGEKFGIFEDNIDMAKHNGLKIYATYEGAQSAKKRLATTVVDSYIGNLETIKMEVEGDE